MQKTELETRRSWLTRGVVLLLAVFVAAAYAWVSWDNAFLFDDRVMIVEQKPIESFSDAIAIFTRHDGTGLPYYRPVTRMTMLAQKTVHGDNPRPFHVFNAVIAGLSFLAAYALLRRPKMHIAFVPAVLAATLFVLHPAVSSCVYPAASGRETLLATMLMLVSAWAWLGPGRWWYAVAVTAFALAQFSKEQAIMMIVIFAAADVLGLTHLPTRWTHRIARYVPVIAVTMIYLLIRQQLYEGAEWTIKVFTEPAGPIWSYLFGLQVTVVPFVQLRYEPLVDIWLSLPRLILAALVLVAVIWGVLKTRSTTLKITLFWLLWFVAMQLPTARILRQEALHSERYVALATLALPAVIAAIVTAWRVQRNTQIAALAGGVLLCAAAFVVSMHRAEYFLDRKAFYQQWIKSDPDARGGLMGLGVWLHEQNRSSEALQLFEKILAQTPDDGEAHLNRASALLTLEQYEAARDACLQAIRFKPEDAKVYSNLAVALTRLGQHDEALQAHEKALAIKPNDPNILQNMGATLFSMGEYQRAMIYLQSALAVDDTRIEAHLNMARLYYRAQRAEEAEKHLRRALELEPDNADAHYELARVLLAKQQLDAAMETLRRVVALQPDRAGAYYLMGMTLMAQRKLDEAVEQFREAVRLKPDGVDGYMQLATIFAYRNRIGDAVKELDTAMAIAPDRVDVLVGLAWILATTGDVAQRDAARAFQLATEACEITEYRDPAALDALAAAYAAGGYYEDAAKAAATAIQYARSMGDNAFANRIEQRQQLYTDGRAYVQHDRVGPQ